MKIYETQSDTFSSNQWHYQYESAYNCRDKAFTIKEEFVYKSAEISVDFNTNIWDKHWKKKLSVKISYIFKKNKLRMIWHSYM